MIAIKKGSIKLRSGGSYFGSGGFSAGFEVLEGKINKEKVDFEDNGFMQATTYKVTPITDEVIIKAHDYDCIGEGIRKLGKNEKMKLIKEEK
jgi:hypothetical protein